MFKENKSENTPGNNIKQDNVSITYEEIGLFPRSFSRVLDRFLKQLFYDVENLVIQEYRFYRYLFLTTLKCLLILFFVPFLVNFVSKNYILHPLIQYIWNTQQTEIFLNSYQQKRAFAELKEFEEKLYFESLIAPSLKNSYKLQLPDSIIIENNPLSSTSMDSLLSANPEGAQTDVVINSNLIGKTGISKTVVSFPEKTKGKREKEDLLNKQNNEKEKNFSPIQILSTSSFERDVSSVSQVNKLMPITNLSSGSLREPPYPSSSVLGSGQLSLEGKELIKEIKDDGLNLYKSSKMGDNLLVDINKLKKENLKKDSFELKLQEKTIYLAEHYNKLSIDAITNFFSDLLSFLTLCYLLLALEIQLNITKSFLLEVFFGLDDSKKSLLILLITDLLVGYHSSNLWELFFEFLFNHYGLPESQTGIFLLVATLPVLLDVLFKYLIFRHLNRSSPATVATYHAMIE